MSSRGSKAQKKNDWSGVEIPFIVKLFEDYLEGWKSDGYGYQAKMRDARFSHLLFHPKTFGLFDTQWCLTSIYEAVEESRMNEVNKKVFRRMKGMDCTLEWKGTLGKHPFFKPHNSLYRLKPFLAAMNISGDLAKSLNDNEALIRAVKTLAPNELDITLYSFPKGYQPLSESEEIEVQYVVDFYNNPSNITWVTSIAKLVDRKIGVRREAEKIIRLFDEIISVIDHEMEEIRRSL